MSKLLDHFKAMQSMAGRYLEPGPYTPISPNNPIRPEPIADTAKAQEAFVNDMIYMLDGPEQREAQAEAESMAEQGYPTEDAYLAVCRALHWRTAELRHHGVEPVRLPDDASHYPPEDYAFGPSAKDDQIDELERQLEEARDQLAVARSDRGRATDKLAVVKAENNELRSRLFESELAYAKLRGYVERIEDERPVELVPAPRERHLAQSPDGTMGTDRGYPSQHFAPREQPKRWYHR